MVKTWLNFRILMFYPRGFFRNFEQTFIFDFNAVYKIGYLKLLGTVRRGLRSLPTFTVMEMDP